MKPCLIFIPEPDLKRIKELIDKKLYPNKNEFVRLAIKDLLDNEGVE